MRAAGRLGGRASVRSRVGISDEVADDNLRAQARRRLERLVNSDNEQIALRASAALYSYRSQQPPGDELSGTPERLLNDRKAISIIDLIRVALLEAEGILQDPQTAAIVREAYAKLPPDPDPATAAAAV